MKNVKQFGKRALALCMMLVLCGCILPNAGVRKAKAAGEYFNKNNAYYIWLKEDDGSLNYRANMDDTGQFKNNAMHLDNKDGKNCTFEIAPIYDNNNFTGYYSMRYTKSDMYIDVEGNDNGKENQKLHQYHDSIKQDTQYFSFEPVAGEADTYYIKAKKSGNYIGVHDDNIERKSDLCTAKEDKVHKRKWYVVPISSEYPMNLPGSESGKKSPKDGAPTFVMNPVGKITSLAVHDDSTALGDRVHQFYLGRTFKVTAEWIPSQGAYKLRSYLNLNTKTGNTLAGVIDYVWDVDGGSKDEGKTVHVWSNGSEDKLSQLWRFEPVSGKPDVYYIKNVNSGKYVSLESTDKDENNNKVVQRATPMEWELHMIDNQNGVHTYTSETTENYINAGNWMSKLPESMPISAINMPGTHDACCTRVNDTEWYGDYNMDNDTSALTQFLYLYEQLNAGVRAWDIRLAKLDSDRSSGPRIIHGFTLEQTVDENGNAIYLKNVLDAASDYLAHHPSETVVMTLKGDGKVGSDDDVTKQALDVIKTGNFPIYDYPNGTDKIPSLKDVRGKIVFVSRLGMTTKVSGSSEYSDWIRYLGPDASLWDDELWNDGAYAGPNGTAVHIGTSNVWAQDFYNEKNASSKVSYVDNTIRQADEASLTDSNFLFNYSAAKDHISLSRDINKSIMTDSLLAQPTSTSNYHRLGYVMTNYIDPKLAERIYLTNFLTDGTAAYDSQSKTQTQVLQAQQKKININVKQSGKAALVKWKNVNGISGVEICVSTDKDFQKNVKTVTIRKKGVLKKKVKKLKKGVTYYIKARAFTMVDNGDGTKQKVYGKYSKTVKFTKK